jgi:predicted PurR-regulated permease PerM
MNAALPEPRSWLGGWAAVFALAIVMGAGAWLLYQLLDVVLLIFLGVTLAAALEPWHTRLCLLGVPRGLAVLLIYLLFALVIAGLGILVVPALIEELGQLLATVPEKYTAFLASLRGSPTRMVRLFGQRLPPFETLPATVWVGTAESVRGIFGFTTGVFAVLTWVVTALAVAAYWTLDLPRVERLVLSVLSVSRRPQALGAWREIESKLGAYLRAQGIVMVVFGVASGVGYVLLGLPNAFALAILAGLLEGVPLLGPFLAAVPALLAALTIGLPTVLLTFAWSFLVQMIESNVLVPRLTGHAVGVSPLVSLVAILALGSAYGVLGVFIAVPLIAVLQVLLDRFVLEAAPGPPLTDPAALTGVPPRARPLAALRDATRRLESALARVDALATAAGPDTPDALPLEALVHAVAQAEAAIEGLEALIASVEKAPLVPVRRAGPAP